MNEQDRHISVWNDCLHVFEQIIEPAQYEKWFKPIRPVSLVDSNLTLEVPSHFFREYLESAFLDEIRVTLKRFLGPNVKLFYEVRPVRSQAAMRMPAESGVTPVNNPVNIGIQAGAGAVNAWVGPGLKPLRINPRLNPNYSFENLIEGECNKIGITAGINISAAPGKTPFNPLFIFGGSGLGKTHLAQAIGNAIHEKYPELVVLFVSGNEFKLQYMDAMHVQNKMTDFLGFYMKIDVLIVDDIHELLGQGSQNAFFNIFNHLHQSNRQLIFTSDRPATELQNFEERLLSRFKWGLSVKLSQPDYNTRLAMLRSRRDRDGMKLDDNVLEYLAANIRTNFRELEGALISVVAHCTNSPLRNPLDIAAEITGNLVGEEKIDLSIDNVQRAVCDYFNITRDDMLSKSRKRNLVQARQIAMFLSRQYVSNCSLATIGAEIGGKDHATVLHACNTVSDLMSTDKRFKKYVNDIEEIIQQ